MVPVMCKLDSVSQIVQGNNVLFCSGEVNNQKYLPKPFSTYVKKYWHLLQKGQTMAKLSCCQYEWSCCVHNFYSGLVICQQECSLYFGVIMERKVKPCTTENWTTFYGFGSIAQKCFAIHILPCMSHEVENVF